MMHMGIVYQINKKTGITYVYENEPYWDKEKQQSRAKRTLIGKLDPKTGEIIPTRAYKKKDEKATEAPAKRGPVPITRYSEVSMVRVICWTRSGKRLVSFKISKPVSLRATNKFCPSLTTWSLKRTTRSAAFPTGSACTFIHMGAIFHHSAAVNSFNPSMRKAEWRSSKSRASGA